MFTELLRVREVRLNERCWLDATSDGVTGKDNVAGSEVNVSHRFYILRTNCIS